MKFLKLMLSAVALLAFSQSAWALSYGDLDEQGRRFLYEEKQEHPFSTNWFGSIIRGNGQGATDIRIEADGKTVFDGVLTLECRHHSDFYWKTNRSQADFAVPRTVVNNARDWFCTKNQQSDHTNDSYDNNQNNNTGDHGDHGQHFTLYHGYDLFGGDYDKLPGRVTVDACIAACKRDDYCKAFTFNTRFKKCFLKSRVPRKKPFKNAISGVK